ncbi:MAG: peptidoglycan DD-metalloendopeptidase family protein [Bacteroidota bacterium]
MNITRAILALSVVAIALRARSASNSNAADTGATHLRYPNSDGANRNCDPAGCGHYGAPRGSRKHSGHDFLVSPGQTIVSPIQGYVRRFAYPYGDDLRWKGLLIIGEGPHQGLAVKMFYFQPSVSSGTQVVPGQVIGKAQDIAAKYPGSRMQPHVHLEIEKDGQRVNPLPFFQN